MLAHLRSRSPALVSGCAKEARSGLYDRFVQVWCVHGWVDVEGWERDCGGGAQAIVHSAMHSLPSLQVLKEHRPELLEQVEAEEVAKKKKAEASWASHLPLFSCQRKCVLLQT